MTAGPPEAESVLAPSTASEESIALGVRVPAVHGALSAFSGVAESYTRRANQRLGTAFQEQ